MVPSKKVPVKADSKPIKKAKSAVPIASSQSSSQGEKKKVKNSSSQATKTAKVKKAAASKENETQVSVMPKKPITSYFAFLNTRREKFKNDNPKLSITEIAKALGQVWQALQDDQKKPYLKVVEEDVARYQRELQDLKTKGYFINKNGENSKDLQKEENRKKASQSGV